MPDDILDAMPPVTIETDVLSRIAFLQQQITRLALQIAELAPPPLPPPVDLSPFVRQDDVRLRDARRPLRHGESAHAGYVAEEQNVKFNTMAGHDHDGTDSKQISHTQLTDIGSNTHTQIDTHIAAVAPHSGHAKTTAAGTITVGSGKDYATVQEAYNSINEDLTGNVIIEIDPGTYAESLSIGGRSPKGAYSITFLGTTTNLSMTATGGTAGTLSTQPTVVKTGAGWTVNAYRGKWIKFTSGTNNNKKRCINSNTVDTLTLAGPLLPAAPANSDTFIIFYNNVDITGDNGIINPTSCELIFQNVNIKGMIMNNAALVRLIEVKQTITGYNNHKRSMSTVWHKDSVFEIATDVAGLWQFGGVCTSDHCLYYEDVAGATFSWAILLQGGAHFLSRNGDVWDGFVQAFWGDIGGTGQIDLTDSYGIEGQTYCFVKNNVTGILFANAAAFKGISQTVFSGNTTNYLPAAASDPAWCGG